MDARIYLDHAATTPLRPEARAAMEPYLHHAFGNPSSLHADGQQAKQALDAARDIVASALGAEFAEISFTSGGTEADNAALVGVMLANKERGDHLITTQIEHEAVGNTARFLETLGFRVTYLPVDTEGRIAPKQLEDALTDRTVLVSVMHANNEVGTIQPLRDISEIVHARGAFLHSDAVQTFGQCAVNVDNLGVDLLSVSAHKIYGPKGAGALYVRRGIPIEPWLHGGGQERQRRSGTENVAAIAGFGEAVRLLLPERETLAARLTALRDLLIARLRERIPGVVLNGHPTLRLPNNVNLSFPDLDAEALLVSLDMAGISASSGSACTAGSIEPSHVLQAMHLPDSHVRSAIRLTLGRSMTEDEVCRTVDILVKIIARLATENPL
ncbi:MAG: cysteine desulfurase [Armatimonadota bacterium]|nr:cysteine desulfurase [Armatimonadota bacterium]